MPPIERTPPTTGPLRTAPAPAPAASPGPTAPTAPKREPDAVSISIDARVKLGDDNKPEVVLEDVEVNGLDVSTQVEKNMKGRRKGLRDQVTEQVVKAIAEQVAHAITPVLSEKLESALRQEGLPAGMAGDLARQAVPEIAKIVAAQLAKEVKVSYSIGF